MNKNLVQLDPPGTFCLNSAFLRMLAPLSEIRSFIEIGPGEGKLSKMLCTRGLKGTGIDLSEMAIPVLTKRMQEDIAAGRYRIIQADFMCNEFHLQVDLVFCMMVLEHVKNEIDFLQKMKQIVRPGGKLMVSVPARIDSWGIEDDVAGHLRRYERKDIKGLLEGIKLQDIQIWSVGVPISNILFSLSNFTIKRSHAARRNLSQWEQTKLSGLRDVPFKNLFPRGFGFFLNKYTMAPFLFLQRFFFNTDLGLVLLACGKVA